jgi:hypothetical protein
MVMEKDAAGGAIPEMVGQLSRIADALEELVRAVKEERESSPHTPYKEKGEVCLSPDTGARTREGNSMCGGMAVPTLEEVKSYAAAALIADDVADDFYNYCDATGWRHKGNVICNWRAMLKAWQRARKRFAAREAKLTAHIDARMDEREKNRAAAATRVVRRRPDNWIGCSDAERKEFVDGLA